MNTKQLIAALSGLALAACWQVSAAKGPSYTYGELGYMHFDADKYDGNGGRVNISFGATEHIFVKMGYARTFVDAVGVSGIDVDRFNFGMGGHMAITDNVDVLGAVSYLDHEYSGGIPSEADEGYQVDLGVRGMVSKKVELNATASYRHMALTSALGVPDDEDIGVEVGTVIKLKKKFHFSGNINYFDETEEAGVFAGIRLNL
jgi:hypothetical protein